MSPRKTPEIKRCPVNQICGKRLDELESKVFDGFESRLDVLKEKVSGIEKLLYAVLSGIILTFAFAIIRIIFKL